MKRYIDQSDYTAASVDFFVESRKNLASITDIFLYSSNLNPKDLRRFKLCPVLDKEYKSMLEQYPLASLMAIRDSVGDEIWLMNCNCGWSSGGSTGTLRVLEMLRKDGSLDEEQFSEEVVEYLIEKEGNDEIKGNHAICLSKKDDGLWDIKKYQSSLKAH